MTRAQSWVAFVVMAVLASACAHGKPTARTAAPAPPSAAEDPISRLITVADAHLQSGVAESRAGHLKGAREEFDRALDTYLEAAGGALSHPRLAEAYRRTLEAIQVHELEALAAGDGFTETPPEPASIDDLADLSVSAASASPEARQVAEEALRGETNDLPITLNDAVLACIDLYQGTLREWFEAALERGGRYLPRIREVFKAEGIPQDLAYVALVESAFKTNALSRAKAKGLWQFIPQTGRRFGLNQDWWVDERSNPEKSTRAAAQYLKFLYEMFQDWNLALAAYNAGENRVARGLDRYNVNDYWQLSQAYGLARETRNYVPMIHAAILVAKAPEKYGFEIDPEPVLRFDTVPVKGAVDLRLVAECAGTDVQRVQLLNPELRRLATPAGRTFTVKVPVGSGDGTGTCLASVPAEKRVAFRTHVVSRGQTFASLAKKYGSSPREIAEANNLSLGRPLSRGAELIIPIRPQAVSRASVARNAEGPRPEAPRTAEASAERGPSEPAPVQPASAPTPEGRVRIAYQVQQGDTLTAIASRFKTTVQRLRAWNRLATSRLVAGDTLTVYTRRSN